MEVTVPGRDTDAAKCRACYNSALGTRAIHSLQTYKEESFHDDMTYAITTVYDAGTGTLICTSRIPAYRVYLMGFMCIHSTPSS